MTAAPDWIDAAVRDFGRGAGLEAFALNERGVAALRFEDGRTLRFEYANDELAVSMSAPARNDAATARRILAAAHPSAAWDGLRVRAGYLEKAGRAVFAVRLAARDVTRPALERAFAVLWRIASECGGAA